MRVWSLAGACATQITVELLKRMRQMLTCALFERGLLAPTKHREKYFEAERRFPCGVCLFPGGPRFLGAEQALSAVWYP
jgi:hypothetical protein